MRRILHANVKRLALCKRGKNGLTTLFKSDGTAEWATLTKGDATKGEVLAVAYPLGLEDVDGDFADTLAAIESMAHSFMKEGAQLDIEHDGEVLPRDAAYVKESFLIQKGDPRFQEWPTYDGKTINLDGGWAVKLQIDDPDLRAAYQRGDWDGVSLFGPAAVEQVDIKAASQRVAARMGGVQEIEMTKEELQAAFAAQKAEIAEMVKSALAGIVGNKPEAAKPTDEPKMEPAPTFTGDPLDPQALADYERALRGYELRKAIADGTVTADKLAELRKSLSETEPSTAELRSAGIPANEGDSPEVRALQVKLFKAQKPSNAPERRNGRESEEAELLKACEAEGVELAKLLNERTGAGMRVVQG